MKIDEARSDISDRRFWSTGQVAFFDVSVFDPNATRYVSESTAKTYEINKRKKKENITNACKNKNVAALPLWYFHQMLAWDQNSLDFTKESQN